MTPRLITSWTDHDNYLQKILLLATRSIRIFDENLSRLGLENPENEFFLRRFLATDRQNTLQIVIQDAQPFRRNSPRLMKLLSDYPEGMSVHECAPHLDTLGDSLFIADDRHALVRFHKEQVRSKAIIDNIAECRPYILRFSEILLEGTTPVSSTTLGL